MVRASVLLTAATAVMSGACADSASVDTRVSAVGGCAYESCADPAEVEPGTVACDSVVTCGEPAVAMVVDVIEPTVTEEATVNAPEVICDGIDQDGDGIDLCDRDHDGISEAFDCDDANPALSPHVAEIRCDGQDQNCDGLDDCDRDEDGSLDRNDCHPDNPSLQCEVKSDEFISTE